MRKSVVSTGIFCLAVGMFAAGSRAQVPLVKLWVTEVYQVNEDGTYTPKCLGNCPTQDLLPGIADRGDLINIEVEVEGWDADTNAGVCARTGAACSVSAQNCADFFCTGGGGPCNPANPGCLGGQTCARVACNKSPILGSYQWTADCSTYSDGATQGVAPAVLGCDTDADCACGYTSVPGTFNDCADFRGLLPCTCDSAACQEDNTCDSNAVAYVDESQQTNSLFVYAGHSSVTAISTTSCNVEVASASLEDSGGVPEELYRCSAGARPPCNVTADCPSGTCELVRTSPYYLGTLLLQATNDACGLYTIDLDHDPLKTFFSEASGAPLPNPIIEALTVDFGPAFPCDDGDPCTINDMFCAGVCKGEPLCPEGVPCVDGVCGGGCGFADLEAAYWSDGLALADDPFDRPGNCAIDARRPFDPNNPGVAEGWDRLILRFSCDPADLAAGLVPSDFPRSTVPFSLAPFLTGISTSGMDMTLQLSRPISPGFYTCISHPDSANQWCAGFLPANANQDAVSNASDINALINSINLVPGFVLPEYATDIDRGLVTNPSDILRLIDLLNGAGAFDPWLGVSLQDCPSAP